MLRKRSRSIHKDQHMGEITSDGGSESSLQFDLLGQRQKTHSFFNVPGLFVGLSPNSVSDCDSVRSPTSPLEFMLFPNLRLLKPSQDCGPQKSWDCNKVGLGSIVDSHHRNLPGKSIPLSNSTILFGSQIRSKAQSSLTGDNFCEAPKSLPKNYAVLSHAKMRPCVQEGSSDVFFEIGDDPFQSDPFRKIQSFSLDSKRLGSGICRLNTHTSDLSTKKSCLAGGTFQAHPRLSLIGGSPLVDNILISGSMPVASGHESALSLMPGEIELSEDYTCVISHGPNPKTIHIYGDCVLDCHPDGIDSKNKKECSENRMPCLKISSPLTYPQNDFLSYCCFCKKKLEEGKDIYMYRGEKAFCSWDCRMEEILIEEAKEKSMSVDAEESPNAVNGDGDEIFEKNMFFAM